MSQAGCEEASPLTLPHALYTLNCVEDAFCELPLYGVLRSSGGDAQLLALAHPPGLLPCRRFPSPPQCVAQR